MATSANELKRRLRKFLVNPESGQEFRVWFAYELRDAHKANDPVFESLVHAIQRAFTNAAESSCTPAELHSVLVELSSDAIGLNQMITVPASAFAQSVNHFEETAFPASAAFSGTSRAVVFGSTQLLPT
jgi:hypothetical protein